MARTLIIHVLGAAMAFAAAPEHAPAIEDSATWLWEHPHARWALVNPDGRSMDGGPDSGARAAEFASQARWPAYIWFQRLGREYVIDDPGTIADVAELLDARFDAWQRLEDASSRNSTEMSELFRAKSALGIDDPQRDRFAARLEVLAGEQDEALEQRRSIDYQTEEKLHRLFDQAVDDGRARLVSIQ